MRISFCSGFCASRAWTGRSRAVYLCSVTSRASKGGQVTERHCTPKCGWLKGWAQVGLVTRDPARAPPCGLDSPQRSSGVPRGPHSEECRKAHCPRGQWVVLHGRAFPGCQGCVASLPPHPIGNKQIAKDPQFQGRGFRTVSYRRGARPGLEEPQGVASVCRTRPWRETFSGGTVMPIPDLLLSQEQPAHVMAFI